MSVPRGAHRAHHYSDHSSANGFYSSGTVDLLGTLTAPDAGVGVDLKVRAGGDVSQSLERLGPPLICINCRHSCKEWSK